MGIRTRNVLLSTGLLALLLAPVGVAATGDVLREGKRNGTALQETKIIANVNAGTGRTGGFATRQSNLSTTGGGAVYGCRAGEGGTHGTPPTKPCLRANNLSTGFAFEFHATRGKTAGLITVGGGGEDKRPFATNATGVATGLNADRVDGMEAAQLDTRWFLLDGDGKIVEQSGGFEVVQAYEGTDPNVYVKTGASLEGHGLAATIAATDEVVNGPGTPPIGEVVVARCGTTAVNCKPAAANNPDSLVVAPRADDGGPLPADAPKRIYVFVTA